MAEDKKENIENVPILTKEDVQRGLKEANERAAKLPHIDISHMDDIKKFIDSQTTIRTRAEATAVLDFFLPLRKEWQEYYLVRPSDVYPTIYRFLAVAQRVLRNYGESILLLHECLSVITKHDNYKWLFKLKADVYYDLALSYYKLNDIEQTRINMRKCIFQIFASTNNHHYDHFSFYAFRPLNKYVIEGIRDNKVSLSNPKYFNDPVDPALITHFELHIQKEGSVREKDFLKLQQEIYKEIRITCLSRGTPLPTGLIDQPPVKDPTFKEINKATMWGYYAKSHTGICIKYEFPGAFTDIERFTKGEVLMLRNVTYKSSYNPRKDSFNYLDAFFSKGKAWKHEGECRLAYFREDGNINDFPWIQLPTGCIKEIYIGYAASKWAKSRLKKALQNQQQAKIYLMHPSNSNLYSFEPTEIQVQDL